MKSRIHKQEVLRAYPMCYNHVHFPSIALHLKQIALVRAIVTGIEESHTSNGYDGSRGKGKESSINKTGAKGSVATVGSSSRLGVRVKIFPYGEQLCAVWVMVASCHKTNV